MFILVVIIGFTDIGSGLINNSVSSLTNGLKENTDNITNDVEDHFAGKEDKNYNLDREEVVISKVIDGDTIDVIRPDGKSERIRLLLIDTPESVHPDEPVEKYGPESSDYAKDYFNVGDDVILEIGNPERDKYDRLLGYIWKDGVNFNKHMVEKGYARIAYVYEPNTKYLDEFEKAEKKAKENKDKIWSIDNYVTYDGFDMSVVDE